MKGIITTHPRHETTRPPDTKRITRQPSRRRVLPPLEIKLGINAAHYHHVRRRTTEILAAQPSGSPRSRQRYVYHISRLPVEPLTAWVNKVVDNLVQQRHKCLPRGQIRAIRIK